MFGLNTKGMNRKFPYLLRLQGFFFGILFTSALTNNSLDQYTRFEPNLPATTTALAVVPN